MLTAETLREIRRRAQEAVADMPDGELKTKAFEVFLQHLLALESPSKPSESITSSKPVSDKSKTRRPGSTKSRILLLKDEGFFALPRSMAEIKTELHAHGWILPVTSLSGSLLELVQVRELRRIKDKGTKQKIWKYVTP